MTALPELTLEPGTAIIGDLHLDVGPSAGREAFAPFAGWLAGLARCPRLIVLGDLFDSWIGPAQLRLEAAAGVVAALLERTRGGTAVDVVPGNRDFLLDAEFERASGARVRGRGLVGLAPAGQRVLLLHGDELCTRDHGYQRLKRVLRSGAVKWAAPRVPEAAALWAARRLRRASVQALEIKPSEEKAQQEGAVLALTRAHGCSALVCGHAHRFRDESLEGGPRWIVVGAFGTGRDVIRVGPEGALEAGEARLGRGSP